MSFTNPNDSSCLKERKWYAFYTKPRHEFVAARQIEEAGIEYYLPTVVKIRQWSDRKKRVTQPLISGYIFIHADEKDRLLALQINSIIHCIAFEGRPAAIPEWQIDNLRKMLENQGDFFITDDISAGTTVKIVSGPFEGVIGKVTDSANGKLISVAIELLKRSVTAYLPKESVVKHLDT